ncbi:MAG: bifunctional (p)ppGpp synthetase/guanosine-3',5'-bis(diphosphate) 3'-pyrophosphohydrolase [Peptostreptococcaceae bacterium]|nr:bifunctional (p)ppGpp synthetase/guanosine-3',5'-bis(diphosphate) 3'-pyrophosphohydrolase [Peptostreptococcaceae bacterium]
MLENLLLRIEQYNPDADMKTVVKAFNYAAKAHENQYRKSGEKYITHPIEVAKILAELELDVETISAGLLHDVIEDTEISYEDIVHEFGKEIADLTDGVTKLGKIAYRSKEETQAENMRKMFLAMGKDIRVVLIKLADRLHNMRTLKHMRPEKAKDISMETIEIYAPIANRLGISKVKLELEDIALRYIDPDSYYDLVDKIAQKKVERDEYINSVINQIHDKLEESQINADVTGRAKHFYSIYRKMKNQNKEFDEIFDLMAVRVLVDSVKDCYSVLGLVHSMWRPIISRMKDYIANPKPNMYQSLHTTVIGPDGEPLEIQMRTWDMHKTAEFGIAAHWKYKEGKINTNESDLESKLAWLRQMMEWQKEISDPQEFMQSLKMDLFANEVYVFTPRSEVIELPAGAVPLDFAYKVHSEVGNKAVGAKVNGRIVPQTYKLQTGDIVEILTSSNSNGPSRDWLNIVQSSHAKNKIRQWFKKERRDDNIKQGKEMFERELRRNGFSQTEVMKQKYIAPILKSLNLQNEEDMYNALGYGGVTTGQIIPRIREKYEQEHKEAKLKKAAEHPGEIIIEEPRKKMTSSDQGVCVKGHSSILIRFAKCCNPLPGDEIVGYVTKGRGVSIHRADCENIDLTDEIANAKLVEVEWDQGSSTSKEFDVEVNIQADDRRGLFVDVSKVFSDEKIMVNSINARTNKESIATMYAGITVSSKEQLKTIMNKLKRVDGVISVTRV